MKQKQREDENAALFGDWARSGRGVSMAKGHGELVAFALKKWALNGHDSLLDIGCGVGLATAEALKAGVGHIAGIDVAEAMIEKAKQLEPAGDFRIGTGEALPWPSEDFTHVLSIESLYYHSDPLQTFTEAHRVLKPGGHLGIAIEFYEDNRGSRSWTKVLGLPMHNWSEVRWREAFEKAGFQHVTSRRIVRKEESGSPETFEQSDYFPSYEDYKTYLAEGALWVEGVK